MTVLFGAIERRADDQTGNFNSDEAVSVPFIAEASGTPAVFKFDSNTSGAFVRFGVYAYDDASFPGLRPGTLLYEGSTTSVVGINEVTLTAVGTPQDVVSGERYGAAILPETFVSVYYSNAGTDSESDAVDRNYTDATVDPLNNPFQRTAGYSGDRRAVQVESASAPSIRKSSTFDITTTLGTITTATLNGVNVFDHVTGQVGTTVSFAGAATDEITTSGEYPLVLGDGVGTETITVQVNVVGVAPSNNPLQRDGSALASLTGVQLRVTSGANINGTELFYSGTATTDASGNLANIDLSSTAAADADPVLLHMRTAAGDSIIASETVGLI